MYCDIRGVVNADRHCVGSDRDHSTQNELLDTKEKVIKKKKKVANQTSEIRFQLHPKE